MYLRRLRTVMDERAPTAGHAGQVIDHREPHQALVDLVDPPGFKHSDAALDNSGRTTWGRASSMRQKPNASSTNTFPAGVSFCSGSRAKLMGDPSLRPTSDAVLNLGPVNIELPPREQFVAVTNPNPFAVDVTAGLCPGAASNTASVQGP